jgi:hypothetical protein
MIRERSRDDRHSDAFMLRRELNGFNEEQAYFDKDDDE